MHKKLSTITPLGEVSIEATADCDIELASGELPHSITNGMTIDGSTAFVLKLRPNSSRTSVQFSARLENPDISGYPATGEHLDCIEFENEGWHLTFGTEDQEVLDARLSGYSMHAHPYPVAYSPSGMTLELEDFSTKGESTFHVIVSYKKLPDERECSAWFFADTPHKVALEAVSRA